MLLILIQSMFMNKKSSSHDSSLVQVFSYLKLKTDKLLTSLPRMIKGFTRMYKTIDIIYRTH